MVQRPPHGQRDVDRQAVELEHAERTTDELDGEVFGENTVQLAGRKTGHFKIQIARLALPSRAISRRWSLKTRRCVMSERMNSLAPVSVLPVE